MNIRRIFIPVITIVFTLGSFFIAYAFIEGGKMSEDDSTIRVIKEGFRSILGHAQSENSKDNDFFNRAIYYKDQTACNKINDESRKLECHEQIIILKNQETGNLQDCDKMSQMEKKFECRNTIAEAVALTKMDKSICEKITDAIQKQRCIENIDAKKLAEIIKTQSANETVCSTLNGNFAKECLRSINTVKTEETYFTAIKGTDLTECTKIKNPRLSQDCRDIVLSQKAQLTDNSNLCIQIINQEKREYCKNRILTKTDATLFQSATTNNNLDGCKEIINEKTRIQCHDIIILSLTKKSKNIGWCDQLYNKDNLEKCKKIDTF